MYKDTLLRVTTQCKTFGNHNSTDKLNNYMIIRRGGPSPTAPIGVPNRSNAQTVISPVPGIHTISISTFCDAVNTHRAMIL